jgi:rare lipoprotein A
MNHTRVLALPLLLAMLALAGCNSVPLAAQAPAPAAAPRSAGGMAETPVARDAATPVLPAAGSGRGGYYQDDGPGDNPPANLADIPDADVRNEPYSTRSNRPYVVFGKTYTPITSDKPFVQRGVSSWYGKKFHGQKTSSGELYDMYKMTAAHPTLPIPSYAKVTSLASGKTVVLRINDRGPFHANRVIDVSYTAALKLGLLGKGSQEVEIERLLPADIDRIIAARGKAPAAAVLAQLPSAPPEIAALMLDEKALPDGAASGSKDAYFVQFGAYNEMERAEAARERLQANGVFQQATEIVRGGYLLRLFGGPFATREAAKAAIDKLPASLNLRPFVIKR